MPLRPASTKMLADWGADVIHVEAPSGDAARLTGGNMCMPTEDDCNPLFSSLNNNKRALCLI
ncbi:MAG: hypothetical protein GX825_06825 [Syntrophomonadaceae bacterium]|nr:hypothetical protein [Syntrophomonadaceae bacterium]